MKDHILLYYAALKFQHTRKVGPRTQDAYKWDPGTQDPQNV